MKSHELFRKLLQNCNAKQLASELRLSTSSIYKWAEPSEEGCSGAANPLDRVEQLMKLMGNHDIAQWVCECSGGFYVKNPRVTHHEEAHSITIATNKIVQEFAEMLSLIASAALDNSITEREASAIHARWQDVKSTTEQFVHCCEEGDFTAIRDHSKRASKKQK